MKILFTGTSSFTGAWMTTALARDGHAVTGIFQRKLADYPPLTQARVVMARQAGVQLAENVSFGADSFMALLDQGFDVLCHHGADVRNYKSPDFEIVPAVANNTNNIRQVCKRAVAAGVKRLIVTGSVAEPHEGVGDQPERALSPYGLSKGLSWSVTQFYAAEAGLPIAKFTIPNPFGRFEEERFCTYLMGRWVKGETAGVQTPNFIRDNIAVDKLARAYADFVALAPGDARAARCNPSGYVSSQGDFTARFAREIGARLKLATPYQLQRHTEFSEPVMRVNTDFVAPDWDETGFWDDLALAYAERFAIKAGAPR